MKSYHELEEEFAKVLIEATRPRPANDPELVALLELNKRRQNGMASPREIDQATCAFKGVMTDGTVDLGSHYWWLMGLVKAGTAAGDALRVQFEAAAAKWEEERATEEDLIGCIEAFYSDPQCGVLLNGWSAFRAWPTREEMLKYPDSGDLRRVLEFFCYGDGGAHDSAEQVFILSEDICPVKVQVAAGTTRAEAVAMLRCVLRAVESESRWQALVSSMDVDGAEMFKAAAGKVESEAAIA